MRRLRLAMTAAIVLSLSPAAAPALSAPISVGTGIAPGGVPLIEVRHRRNQCHRDVRRHYHRGLRRSAWHRHVGPNCRPRLVRRNHHRGHRDGGCIRIGDFRICF
jgi:hypothetical protein